MKKLAALIVPIFLFTTFITTTSAQESSFADVGSDETYHAGIQFLAEMKIVNGNPDGTYKPEKVLNRAEMIKIIAEGAAKYYDWPEDVFDAYASVKCFTDVQINQWYTKYICYGKEKGWVKGYEDGTYKPNQEVTFVESLKITYMGFDLGYSEEGTVWYKNAVEKASEKNFIPFTIKAFNAGLKRNEMADLVTRIIKSNENEAEFEGYLGARANVQVTYESIEKGEDLSVMGSVEIGPGESEEDDDDDCVLNSSGECSPLDEIGVECFIMGDGKCYKPGENVDDTDCIVDQEGGCEPLEEAAIIEMTNDGFSPAELTIKAGDTVEFMNTGTDARWPASASHPTHTVYPGSDINKCFNGQKAETFDACGLIEASQRWSFTFNEKGTWNYHDHISPGTTGQIVVE